MPPELADKLLEWERKRRDGTPVTPEELCADSPELVDELRRRIRRLEACDRLLGLDETPLGPAELDSEIPVRIDEFEVRGRLGHGGMGDVYDAWDPTLRRDVAIKVLRLPPDHWPFARTEELTERFSREGSVLARLDHPHIVPVYHAGVCRDRPYIVMARIGGGSLAARREEFTEKKPREVAEFMEKVARAVHAAHQKGILHRDLKPANVLLGGDGEPRVADFGLAKFWLADEPTECSTAAAETPQTELTAAGVEPGTPSYMAPEQLNPGFGSVGPASDVWALGIILHELLTGKRPFTGEKRRDLVECICRSPAPSCRKANRRVPAWLDAVVARSLAKDLADRFTTAAEQASALRRGLQRRQRYIRIAIAVALVATLLAVGFAVDRWVSRERPFEEQADVVARVEQLSRREPVTLVDAQQRARMNWIFGKDTGHVFLEDPTLLQLHGRWIGPSTAEFLPSLPEGRYRVRAVVQHVSGFEHTKIGLYVGGRQWQSARGEHLECLTMYFADVGSEATPVDVEGRPIKTTTTMACLLTGENRAKQSHWSVNHVGDVEYVSAGAARVPPGFRTVEFLITETAVEGWWEGRLVGRISMHSAAERFREFREQYPPILPMTGDLSPFRGGIGLFVYNGQMNVKEFQVIPEG